MTGHDETSEPISQNFKLASPTPGTTVLEVSSGNGSGVFFVTPDSVKVDSTVSPVFVIKGTVDEFNGVTEITGYSLETVAENQPLPMAIKLATVEATDLDRKT